MHKTEPSSDRYYVGIWFLRNSVIARFSYYSQHLQSRIQVL